MEFFQAGHINDNLGFRRVAVGVIILRRTNDQIDDVREAAATATAFCHGMVDFGGYDELPTVFIKELDDSVPDFLFGNVIATANQHSYATRQT
ncbi:hypothetical protein YH62_23875 [Rhizobium sp. LC145]|nr:hypothetical protein YH62_23875 [Rhizobium sp. LC145]